MRWLIALFVFAFLAGCVTKPAVEISQTSSTPSVPPRTAEETPTVGQPDPTLPALQEEDQFAYHQLKRLGRGVNLGNALEAPNEGEWGVVLQPEYFQLIKKAGFQSVRIPVRWSAHALNVAPYTIDPAFFERVDWAIDQAKQNELAVVVNIHHYEEMFVSPQPQIERFLSLWDQIARHYQNEPDQVMFELLNEPNSTLSSTIWNDLAGKAIKVVRISNPTRTIVVGPADWNGISALMDLALPEDERNLIVTVHYYLPFQFTHQGAEWVNGSSGWLGTTWRGTSNEKSLVDFDLDLAAVWGRKFRRPIYLGEFGAYSKADSESRHIWTDYVARGAEARGLSWAYWEFCAGFGVYDPTAKKWNEPILTALIPTP